MADGKHTFFSPHKLGAAGLYPERKFDPSGSGPWHQRSGRRLVAESLFGPARAQDGGAIRCGVADARIDDRPLRCQMSLLIKH